MARKSAHQIVTANRLLQGDVVYFNDNGAWTRELRSARVASDNESAARLLHRAEATPHLVVGPYLVDVELDEASVPSLCHMREVMRETGPSVAAQPS
ncbi:MAG: hypothetical protein ACI8W7_000980 [Gammaproteobacteria bacterium]|jgi:hypothetical protein